MASQMALKYAPQGKIVKVVSRKEQETDLTSAVRTFGDVEIHNNDRLVIQRIPLARVTKRMQPGTGFRALVAWMSFLGAATWSSYELRPVESSEWLHPIEQKAEQVSDQLSLHFALERSFENMREVEFKPSKIVSAEPEANVLPVSEAIPPVIQTSDVTEFLYKVIHRASPKRNDIHFLARQIVQESHLQGYDPLFVAAVIKSESAFNAFARSHVGAQGLMQIMPATGKWLGKFPELQGVDVVKLTDPKVNVKLGITYLRYLEEVYEGNKLFVLAAYNWGPARVDGSFKGQRRVPEEVMRYAVKILNDFRKWKGEYSAS